jgi:hypothetical protein
MKILIKIALVIPFWLLVAPGSVKCQGYGTSHEGQPRVVLVDQKTAHVVAVQTPRRYLDRGTQMLIGNLMYDSRDTCKEVEVGSDYPASVVGDKIEILAGKKICKFKIRGVTEVAR